MSSSRDEIPPSWNVATTDQIYAVVERRGGPDARRRLRSMRWGLVPSWSKTNKTAAKLINARAETLTTKPAFRAAAARRRCLIPSDGWYEWRPHPIGTGKQPYYMTPTDGGGLTFAGLWEFWRDPEGEPLVTCSIMTTTAVGRLAKIHDRMPLVLSRQRWSSWLDLERDDPTDLLEPDVEQLEDWSSAPWPRRWATCAPTDPR